MSNLMWPQGHAPNVAAVMSRWLSLHAVTKIPEAGGGSGIKYVDMSTVDDPIAVAAAASVTIGTTGPIASAAAV